MSASVLVVEDDLNMQELLVETLEDEGYTAQGADSSEQAVSLAQKTAFDLVVTDVRMAGTDGVDGLVPLKRLLPDLKCIVITGFADTDAPARAIKIQIDDYLNKPFGLDEFLSVVERVLQSRSLFAYYQRLIQKVSAAPARLFAAAAQAFQKDHHKALGEARDRAFQGLYVGIRSDLISCYSANGMFATLAKLDDDYRAFLDQPDKQKADSLTGSYQSIFDFLTALARSTMQFTSQERLPNQEFRHLFNAVANGDITPEQLHLAPTLRTIEDAELKESPELRELKLKMWGS